MNKLVIVLLFVFVTKSYSNTFWEAAVQSFTNLVNKEVLLKLNLTRKCLWQIDLLLDHEDIALQMFDAWAKLPYSGMLDSGRMELGNFDECVSIDKTYDDVRILGKYCYSGLIIPDLADLTNIDAYYKLATCIPDACTANDLLVIADHYIPDFPSLFIDDFCTTKETGSEITFGTIVTSFVFCMIIFLVFLSTLYDIYCHNVGRDSLHPLLIAFSVVTNTKKIITVTSNRSKETIRIFNGFRIISVVWIIAGHNTQSFITQVIPTMNNDHNIDRMYVRLASYLFAANLAVSTFFYMSGFLVSYLYFKENILPWKDQLKSIPFLYLHRYIRLTVPVLLLYLAVLYIVQHLGSGPLWYTGSQTEIDVCKKYWWSYFLYIQNYANYDEVCIMPLWYLSADMQLFVLAPLVLIPTSIVLKSHGLKFVMGLLACLNTMFLIVPLGIKLIFPGTAQNLYGVHDRLTDYYIGFMMGLFMRFTKDEPFFMNIKRKYTSKINLVLWIITLSGMFAVVMFYEDAEMWFDHNNKYIYFGFGRVIWTVGLSWIVYSCYHGYGGVVNWILCRPIFEVGAKLSYSMYLLHYLFMGHFSLSNRMKFNIDEYVQFYVFCGLLIETLGLSFLWTLGIESPILMIEKYFLKTYISRKSKDIKEDNNKNLENIA